MSVISATFVAVALSAPDLDIFLPMASLCLVSNTRVTRSGALCFQKYSCKPKLDLFTVYEIFLVGKVE